MMKRTILATTMLVVSTIISCSGSSGGDRPKVAFVTNCVAEFWTIGKAGATAAGREFDVDVEVHMPASGTAIEQKQILEDLVIRGFGGIAVSPKDPVNHTRLLNSIASKIPLITHDSDAPKSDRLVYVGMDNYKAGRMCGSLLLNALPNGGEVVILIGTLDQDNAKRRRQGVIDVLLGRSQYTHFDPQDAKLQGNGFTILETFVDRMDPVEAGNAAEDAINRYGGLDAMVGLFEYEPPAILKAVRDAKKTGSIRIAAFDENEVTLDAINAGEILGTIVQDPYNYGWHSVRILAFIVRGEDRSVIPESGFYDIPAKSITQENVKAFRDDLATKLGQ